MEFKPQPLKNDLVSLVLLTQADFERLFLVASDPQIWEQHPAKDRYKREVFKFYFDGALASETSYLIFEQENGQLIGCTRYYDYDPVRTKIAIGYTFLAKAYWGSVYNKAVKSLMTEYAFQYVTSILFHIAEDNIRSQKAILKIGAKKTGEVDFEHYGSNLRHFEYELRKQANNDHKPGFSL